MAEGRPLEAIRSDLRGAKAFAVSPSGNMRFLELLAEARQACADKEAYRSVLRELGLNDQGM